MPSNIFPFFILKMNFNHLRKKNNYTCDESQITSVYFNDLENKLIDKIRGADYVMGCVSWLTNSTIIEELEKKKGVKIIIQKENFLKRDFSHYICFNKYFIDLRKGYKSLPNLFNNISNLIIPEESAIHQLCTKKLTDDDEFDAVRCFGYTNKKYKPLMHHKFLVFFDNNLKPTGVWTGSYNITNNANKSLDNVIFSKEENIINAYIDEFEQFLFLSEKLNWTNTNPADS